MIDIDKVLAYVDQIGIEEARSRIDNYASCPDAPTIQEYFGCKALEEFEREIRTRSHS